MNCSSAAVQLTKRQSQSLRLDPYVSHREGSILSCGRPPMSEGHPKSMVCSRLGVRLYPVALRSGPVTCVQQHASCQLRRKGNDDCPWWQGLFFIFLKCCGMTSCVYGDAELFSPSMIGCLSNDFFPLAMDHWPFIWHFLRLKQIISRL